MHQKDKSPQQIFELKKFTLQSGVVLPKVLLSYAIHGKLSESRDNAIMFPTWFASTRSANNWLIGESAPLDTSRYAVIVVDALGNGESTSPSHAAPEFSGLAFPPVSVYDNVRLQAALLNSLEIESLELYIGRSMGAQQAFCFSACFPHRVKRMLALTGSAVTTPHNYVFLDGLEAALTADADFYTGNTEPLRGLSAFGRVFAGWVLSQQYYRREGWRNEVDAEIGAYIKEKWEQYFWRRDAYDLFSLMQTWKRADLADNPFFAGDRIQALGAISAKAFLMPSRTDLYFPVEDSLWAASKMQRAEVRVIESDFGHRAGTSGSTKEDVAFLGAAIRELLES